MEKKEDYEKLYDMLLGYEQEIHKKNQKRIRIGLVPYHYSTDFPGIVILDRKLKNCIFDSVDCIAVYSGRIFNLCRIFRL